MNRLTVPGESPATSSAGSTPTWVVKLGREEKEFDNINVSYESVTQTSETRTSEVTSSDDFGPDDDIEGGAEAAEKESALPTILKDTKPESSGDFVRPRTFGRHPLAKKTVNLQEQSEEETEERLADNISEYFLWVHTDSMVQWYETTTNMLINKQEYAVEAVKLEWLLKNKSKPKPKSATKSKAQPIQETKETSKVPAVQERSSDECDSGDENINTLSDISDEIMDGRLKKDKRGIGGRSVRKHNPKKDYRRLYDLLKY